VTHDEKLALVRQLASALKGDLENLVVRDLDLVEDPAGDEGSGEGIA
jgi:hypothetical protein